MSTWGRRHGLPDYDSFRTGLTFGAVKRLMFDAHERHTEETPWRYKRRGTVLGLWHDLKLQLYYQAIDAQDARRAA